MRAKKLLFTLGLVVLLATGTVAPAAASQESLCIAIDDETGKVYIGFWNCV